MSMSLVRSEVKESCVEDTSLIYWWAVMGRFSGAFICEIITKLSELIESETPQIWPVEPVLVQFIQGMMSEE